MKKNQWNGKAAGVLLGVLLAALAFGMPGADEAFAKTQTPQEAAEKVTQAWHIISIYGGSERRYIRQRISVRRMGQYDNRMDEPACAQNKERHEGLYG